jgi:YD repeat-containing protein
LTFFLALLLATSAMPVLTEPAGADETTEAGRQEEGASLAEAARVAKKEELEHTEWLSSTEAVHQRETSQSAFVGLSAKDAQGLLLETFPEQLRELNSDPARVLSELEIEEPLGTYGARISSGGETAVVESSVPVQSDLGGNGSEPVDLALQRSGSGYVPQNPLTEVELPGSAADPIALHDGVEVELPTSGDHAVEPLGDKNLFIAEAETDTDTLIAPTAAGVEVFEQLRSPESPEEFRFPFNLPQGAKIQEGAHGVEVLSATGELLEEVPAPTAVDAQGTSVPVTMNVEGEALVIDVAHRSADIAYPLLLDPRYNEGYESPPLNSAWTSYSNGPYGLGQSPSSLLAYSQGNSVSYAANTRGQWEYTAPGETTYIENASFAPIYFYVNNCPTSEPYGWVGIANSGGYNSYGIYSGGNISSPGGFQAGNGGVGTRKAVVGIGTVNASTLKCAHEMWVGGVTVQENDPEKPTINSVSGVPSGWFDPAKAGNVTISATDPGFGVDSVRIANAGGGGSEDSVGCTGMWNSRCPRNVNWTVSPPYKGGERQLYVSAEDPTGKVGEWSTTTKVDATKPEIDLGGQLAYATEEEGTEGEENEAKENKLSLPVYNLHIDAIDGSNKETQTKQSGVKKIELFLDGVLQKKWEAPACPENSCSLEENYPLHLTGLEEGEHKLEVVATDRVGLSRPRTIEFEYIPATGITDEYVMQHFPLPDGEEGEEGSHGPELAVNVMNGNLVYHERDAKVSTPSTNVEVERFYNSQLPEADSSEWGKGWTLSQTPRFTPEEGSGKEGGQPIASALGSSGAVTRAVKLPSVDGEERFDPHLHATVTKLAGGGYEVADESSEGGETITYDSSGKPSETRTGTYSKVNYGYEGGKLSEIAVQDPAATDTPPEEALEEEGASGQPVYRSSLGASGTEDGEVLSPGGMALDTSGHLWVADRGNDRVQEFGSAGEYLGKIGSFGSGTGRLRSPAAVAIDSGGDVWVADAGNDRLEEFNQEGKYLSQLGAKGTGSGQFSDPGPQGLAIDSEGGILVADTGGGRIERFSKEGKFIESFGASELSEPTGIAVGPGNRIWVTDGVTDEVLEFSSAGKLIRQFGSEGEEEGQFQHPSSIAVDTEGRVWVCDTGTGRVQELTEAGEFLHEFGSEGSIEGRLKGPKGIVADTKGDVWVAGVGSEASESGPPAEEEPPAKEEPPAEEPAEEELGEGPVASYSFNEGSGETAHDSSGHHHDATLHGASWTGEGKYGGAIHFNAADHDHLTIPASPQLNFSKAFTLEAWVKPEEERKWAPIFAKTEASEEAGFSYLLYARNGEGKPEGQVLEGKENWSSPKGAEALPQNAWSHVALVSDGEDMRLFVNGKVVDTENAATPPSTEGALQIGGDSWGEYFDGAIDEVRLYDRALDGEEIREDGETPLEASPTVPAYQIQKWSVSSSPPPTEPADDPSLSVGYESGLVSSVESDQAPTQSYEHEGGLLTAHVGPEGKAEYAYDEAERLTEVRLPNGTTAKIEYEAALGRVTAVTVDPVGEAPAKTTHFKYTDEPRETVVTPEAEQATHYSIGADGSVLKWWNEKSPPEIEELTGSLYSERGEVHPEPISSGDQVLEVEAYDPEGVASIEIVANGSDLVAEKTCQEPEDECPKLSKEFITETENWPPGILQLEVIVTDRENQVASERFWDNIPYTPPPGSEAPEPPRFEEILRFREEFGLDLDLKGNERARNERIFDLIDAWHNPNTYLGEVARSSMERWGVPMRPQDVAEMEYREWYIANDIPLIEEWAEAQAPGTYAGYYVDHREGGIIHVGFTQNQAERLSELKQQVSLTASDRLAVYPAVPSTPHASLQATVEAVEGDWDTNSVLEALVTEVGIDEESNTVQVGATDVAQVESILRADLGASAPVSVIYETSGEPFAGRNRTSGRILAGDRIINANRSEGCTAGFGAWEARTKKSTDELTVAMFLLIAGHCGSIGDGLWRAPSQNSVNKSEWKKIGDVTRTGAPMGGQHYETDAAAVRLEDSGLVPRAIFRNGQNARPVGQAGTAKHGEVLCFSGQKTNEVQCGEMIGVRRRSWPSPGRHIFIITRFAGLPGDSGAPVWSPRTGKSIGLVSGGPNRPGLHKDWVTPLVTPRGFSSEKVPGALGAPGMYSLNIMEGD